MEHTPSNATQATSRVAREIMYSKQVEEFNPETSVEYSKILEDARIEVTTKHKEVVGNKNEMINVLMGLIAKNNWSVPGYNTAADLAARLYEDMAGFGCISIYLEDPNIEEIDCNRWDDIELLMPGGWKKAPEHFTSPQQCEDITRKMIRLGGGILDGQTPVSDSYISAGVRISAAIPPIAAKDAGAVFSIRKQGKCNITREELVDGGTATDEELNFLLLCLSYGVSIGFAGATGAGKTTDVDFLCRNLATHKRIILVEDSREMTALRTDEAGNVISRTVSLQTRLGGDYDVTRADLLRLSLRFTPDIIVPAEIRGAEAREAVEAARTGHTTLTTLHADNAVDAYTRILTMYSQGDSNLSESLLLSNIAKAFPIMVFKRRLADGSRKYVQIIEALGHTSSGKLKYNVLFDFAMEDNIYNRDGTVTVKGEHRRRDYISNELATRLLEHGAPAATIRRFASPDWKPTMYQEEEAKS